LKNEAYNVFMLIILFVLNNTLELITKIFIKWYIHLKATIDALFMSGNYRRFWQLNEDVYQRSYVTFLMLQ